jgi:hypothetical protein
MELKSLTKSEEVANSLARVEQFHRQYHELFDREVGYIRAKQTYAQSRYQQERDKVFESAMNEFERLKTLLQTDLHDKLQGIDRAARAARQIAITMTLIVILLGTWFSFRISKSIAVPPKELKLTTEAGFLIPAKLWSRRLTTMVSHALTSLRRRLALSKMRGDAERRN